MTDCDSVNIVRWGHSLHVLVCAHRVAFIITRVLVDKSAEDATEEGRLSLAQERILVYRLALLMNLIKRHHARYLETAAALQD